ncbi:5-amino-6-(5-phosphoribosylamino)uracil reductase [Jatrophihabitans sp. GAS493]|uniref:RibD family protein n=1 Tax=Jatrophihabitans sp. GAS493 TaxID=1907575 RepID=UPI000BB76CD9|nr:dihydrofolate reductase family protein [Jatrophihabitans sp. GAS493]SOD74913.1 5-amino-6-(5-phosphoribosylamino)uracil reductase [Jatrophihabitans sp. GAS493]
MTERPYILLSCGVSIDGYLDSATVKRLTLSNEADLDRVDEVRARSDAILVGATTVRNDNCRLLVRSPARRAERVARGLSASPLKVTLTRSAELDPASNFFTCGDVEKLVYCPRAVLGQARDRFGSVATVVDGGCGPDVDLRAVSADLLSRGVTRLMVEGGGTILTQFLAAALADELQLVVAPLFVGDSRARRFVNDGHFRWNETDRANLLEVRQIGDVVLLRYALSARAAAASRPAAVMAGKR